nr:hypothetical protein [Tanacetum cinerariifolium]
LTQVSHLFYVDDAVLMGNWSDTNIDTIIRVLECFHKASSLRINLSKSKLLGILVSNAQVEQATNKIVVRPLNPFIYLEDEDTIKWGRLTLLKSVFGSLTVYHISLFKVPQKVLHVMEAIRRNFFNGIDHKGKKQAWISWNKVLASKDNGGLAVIKEIHGDDGKLDTLVKNHSPSLWLDIVLEVQLLKTKGINLMGFMLKKMGNGEDTLFWDHVWRGERTFKSLYPRVYALETQKKVSVASKMSLDFLSSSFRRAPRSGVEEDQYIQLVKDMEGVFLVDMKDR